LPVDAVLNQQNLGFGFIKLKVIANFGLLFDNLFSRKLYKKQFIILLCNFYYKMQKCKLLNHQI